MDTRILESSYEILRDLLGVGQAPCAMVLGSGWGEGFRDTQGGCEARYSEIPVLSAGGVTGHQGIVSMKEISGMPVLTFFGRRHWYEGLGWEPIAFPVYAARRMGAAVIVLTNAAGAIRSDLRAGDLMIVDDHINAMGTNPLIGGHDPFWGARFPDQSRVYDTALRSLLDAAAESAGVSVPHGVYAAVDGPVYETPAEVAALASLGAHAVGMSSIPEAMLASACGMRVAGLSAITNRCASPTGSRLSHEDILAAGTDAAKKGKILLSSFLERLAGELSGRE